MNTITRTAAGIGTAVALAVPTAMIATPAHADTERRGTCGGGVYEMSIDREDGGFEVSVDLDRVAPGSRWKVVIRHDGNRIANVVRRADNEGDLDVERFQRNTRGADTFKFRAKRVGAPGVCSASATLR